jgi:lipopolysaccharide/colanic/teichoic acid biosynthesis glycosyltransferase
MRNYSEGRATAVDEQGRPVFKTAFVDASRITRVGAFLRRSSLDEAPQFWNVLRGEMSVVGPRPALPYEAELYDEGQRRRFSVKPGLTGLYQVSARNRVPIGEMVRLDLEYAERQSLWLDLIIMAKTPVAMFSGI